MQFNKIKGNSSPSSSAGHKANRAHQKANREVNESSSQGLISRSQAQSTSSAVGTSQPNSQQELTTESLRADFKNLQIKFAIYQKYLKSAKEDITKFNDRLKEVGNSKSLEGKEHKSLTLVSYEDLESRSEEFQKELKAREKTLAKFDNLNSHQISSFAGEHSKWLKELQIDIDEFCMLFKDAAIQMRAHLKTQEITSETLKIEAQIKNTTRLVADMSASLREINNDLTSSDAKKKLLPIEEQMNQVKNQMESNRKQIGKQRSKISRAKRSENLLKEQCDTRKQTLDLLQSRRKAVQHKRAQAQEIRAHAQSSIEALESTQREVEARLRAIGIESASSKD